MRVRLKTHVSFFHEERGRHVAKKVLGAAKHNQKLFKLGTSEQAVHARILMTNYF